MAEKVWRHMRIVTNVYFAGRLARRAELRAAAADVEAAGGTVTSSWLWAARHRRQGEAASAAARDLADLATSDLVVAFTEPSDATARGNGGRHFELGFAHAKGIPAVLVGPREHVFHWLPEVSCVADWAAAHSLLLAGEFRLPLAATRCGDLVALPGAPG